MVGGVELVCNRKPKIIFVQFDQSGLEWKCVTKILSKSVCLELKTTTKDGHEETQQLQEKIVSVNRTSK